MRIRLSRLGPRIGAYDIEPSCGVLDILEGSCVATRIVTDCGLIPRTVKAFSKDVPYHAPDFSFFDDGVLIDAVRVTHAHTDHVGLVPRLARYLAPHARVWMTRPTHACFLPVLEEGLRLSGMRRTEPPFDYGEMLDVVSRANVIEKPGEVEILPGITDFVWPRGHINGACSFTTRLGRARIHYAGDGCEHDQPGVKGAPPHPADWRPHVIAGSDATYGADKDSDSRSWKDEMDKGYDACAHAVKAGHPALWFTFALHRGGALAHEMSRRGLPDLAPVFLDGSAKSFARLMMSPEGRWCAEDTPLLLNGITMVSGRERDEIAGLGGYTVITPPGMGGPGGLASYWRRIALPDPGAVLIFTGFVAPGTDGDLILRKAEERDSEGKEVSAEFRIEDPVTGEVATEAIPIRARVIQIRTGSHDSRGKILKWFERMNPEVAVLSHGSRAALESLEKDLSSAVRYVFRADRVRTIELDI